MAANSKPTVHLTVAKLRKEVEKPEPFGIGLSNSKVIIFPDLFDMESEEAEKILASVQQRSFTWPVLRRWLPKADADALKAEKLTLQELTKVVRAASDYYEDFYGKPGEDDASEV